MVADSADVSLANTFPFTTHRRDTSSTGASADPHPLLSTATKASRFHILHLLRSAPGYGRHVLLAVRQQRRGEVTMAFVILGLSLYLWIALISLIFLVVLTVLGGQGLDVGGDVDADVDFGQFSGPGISPLSLPLVASFGTTFGATGALLETQGFSTLAVAGSATVSALVISMGLFVFVQRFLVRSQTSSDVHPAELVGRSAQVMVPIHRGATGQILVMTEERGRTLFPAAAEDEIPREAVVEILGFSGGVANVRRKTS